MYVFDYCVHQGYMISGSFDEVTMRVGISSVFLYLSCLDFFVISRQSTMEAL